MAPRGALSERGRKSNGRKQEEVVSQSVLSKRAWSNGSGSGSGSSSGRAS